MKSLRKHLEGPLAPLATAFTGVGGLLFHAGHGPEHILCLVAGCALAVGGAVWGFVNRSRSRPR